MRERCNGRTGFLPRVWGGKKSAQTRSRSKSPRISPLSIISDRKKPEKVLSKKNYLRSEVFVLDWISFLHLGWKEEELLLAPLYFYRKRTHKKNTVFPKGKPGWVCGLINGFSRPSIHPTPIQSEVNDSSPLSSEVGAVFTGPRLLKTAF